MLLRPPRESQAVSWLIVIIWTVIIYLTIPLARTIQKYVAQHWGRELFTYTVLITIVVTFVVSAIHVIRHRPIAWDSYFWLITVAAIFIVYTIKLGAKSPEEATHFIQYGILSILVYRGLTHRVKDISIYLSGAIICGIIGALDEAIQWLIPDRHWDLRDIWINFFAGALIQIGIAKSLKPNFIVKLPNRASVRFLCCLLLVAAVFLGVCLLNTPKRIAWYAERIPLLDFLIKNESLMAEYGHLYKELGMGHFRSRFSREELKIIDSQRAVEAAKILDRFQEKVTYQSFLKIYTPITDPFVHEARVHLYSRDQHFNWSFDTKHDLQEYARHLTIARHENRFIEKYFSNTLAESNYIWPEEIWNLTRKHLLKDMVYKSWVSKNLITMFSEGQVAVFFVIVILGLSLVIWHLGRKNYSNLYSK